MDAKHRIIELRRTHPLLTGSEMGRMIGVSRQYVSKILKREGLHNIQAHYQKTVVTCMVCGNVTPRGQRLCPTGSCKDTYYNIEVMCTFCTYRFKMKRSHIVQRHRRELKHIYCSRACYERGKKDGLS